MSKLSITFVSVCLALAQGQDTHYCPDGWVVADIGGVVDCILVGNLDEFVTKQDAEILCGFHDAWLVDMDEGHGGQKNEFVKKLVDEAQGNSDGGLAGHHYDHQFWIGATCEGRHDDHNWGYWTWDHAGTEVTWFDWAQGEPNDWHNQRCLAFLTFFDPFGYHVIHWNDWGCDQTARYICEKPANMPTEAPTEPPTEPTEAPTEAPTDAPTEAPTDAPTDAPTEAPTEAPTQAPTEAPTDAPNCAAGWEEHDGKCYKLFEGAADFSTAETICRLDGGYLASISSEAENTYISNLLNGVEGWLGATYDGSAGWTWLDGTNWGSETFWVEGNEITPSAGDTAIKMSGATWTTAVPLDTLDKYVCEKDMNMLKQYE